jgi:hypothetical protein
MPDPARPARGSRVVKLTIPADLDARLDAFLDRHPVRPARAVAAVALMVKGLDTVDAQPQALGATVDTRAQ